MGQWTWVLAGYGIVYGSLAGYAAWLAGRMRRARRDVADEGRS